MLIGLALTECHTPDLVTWMKRPKVLWSSNRKHTHY